MYSLFFIFNYYIFYILLTSFDNPTPPLSATYFMLLFTEILEGILQNLSKFPLFQFFFSLGVTIFNCGVRNYTFLEEKKQLEERHACFHSFIRWASTCIFKCTINFTTIELMLYKVTKMILLWVNTNIYLNIFK